MDLGAQGLRLTRADNLPRWAKEGRRTFRNRDIDQMINIVRGLGIGNIVVQKRPDPGIARFRVGSQPDQFSHRFCARRGSDRLNLPVCFLVAAKQKVDIIGIKGHAASFLEGDAGQLGLALLEF